MKIFLIADDLTGALDASVAFAARGMSVLCACTPDALSEAVRQAPDVVAVSTNSRDLDQGQAVSRLSDVLEQARATRHWPDLIVFKKVDSRLKGHIGAEMSVLARHRSDGLICPAVPRLGRFVRNGAVCGAGVDEPIPVADRIGGHAGRILDAERQEDLDAALATAALSALYVGAAGLAEALARRMTGRADPGMPPRVRPPALLAIGSRDPVTLAQIEGFDPFVAPNGQVPPSPADPAAIRMVQLGPGTGPVPPEVASERFADGLATWVRRQQPATLFVCGGATTAAVLRVLNCTLVRIAGEILPGLPVSRMVDGCPGLTLITKSGGFGAPDTLHHLARKLNAATD
ncbi:four-carbon acid sugar kinase family protein [Oceaniglobus indicus]|uniref:four-carbon acid sugar kinase family protein n=1 Tax=Oceaniglobus indicus TaxID=2047749 RepID=UPI000C17EF9B|nr:four-carbon acid sugar kinase family protein [Oceaniglobus indicus]